MDKCIVTVSPKYQVVIPQSVRESAGVCFMAALRGEKKDLAPYLAKPAR